MSRAGWAACICVCLLAGAGCASRSTSTANLPVLPAPVAAAPVLPAEPVATKPPVDQVAELIADSTRHFEAGQQQVHDGHLDHARVEFNRALELLMEWRPGLQSDRRLRDHFDRLVQRISAVEILAVAEGDGFAEQRSEPAAIDALLDSPDTAAATPETARTVEHDLESTKHDIDIPLNPRVLAYVEAFSGRLKGYLEEGLARGARYLPMIQEVFRAEGLPLDLAYVPLVESAFKPSALSRAKARGIWQFMRGTGLENGLRHDWYIDERADPEKATRAAAQYLKALYEKFGDWHLALASYNGGPGRVQRSMRRSGRDDFWQISSSTRYLPRETRNYVPLIMAAIIVAKNPVQYGLTIEPVESPTTEVVTLSAPADLRRIAEWIDTPVQQLQDLNPELRRWITPVRETDYELNVPVGTAETIKARLAEVTPVELAPLNRHTVKRGETIATIARALKVKRADLAEANYLSQKARLVAGQQLVIPRAPTLLLAGNTAPAAGVASDLAGLAVSGDATPAESLIAASAPARRAPQEARVVHRVRRGETLFSIAKQYSTSVVSLRELNGLRGTTIRVGQRLTVRSQRTVAAD